MRTRSATVAARAATAALGRLLTAAPAQAAPKPDVTINIADAAFSTVGNDGGSTFRLWMVGSI